LTLKPAYSARLTTICMITALIGGLLFYGVGFAEVTGSVLISIIRTPFCVIRMFVGINELSTIAGTTLVSTKAGLVLFWFIHLLGFYSMASAAMLTLGQEALKYLRMLLSRRGDLTLIYGINDHSIALGKECLAAGNTSVVFVADSADSSTVSDLNYKGMMVLTGPAAASADLRLLRRLGADTRELTVYALDDAEDQDLRYALRLRDALQELGVPASRTRITLPGTEDIITSMLQVSEDAYGFGYVNVFDRSMLAARAMIRTCPPWDLIRFGADGRAEEDFDCVIVGFGSHGQAALKQLLMNGQFAGSHFHAAVFSPNFAAESGYLKAESPGIFENYDIESFSEDGRSQVFYDYIGRHIPTLKLIAVCTGSEELNREISDNLMLYLKRRGAEQICVIRCGKEGVRYQETVGSPIISTGIYTTAFLSAEKADRSAIILNSTYDSSDRTDWEKWVACDTFGKMSSRASADFSPAFLRMAGMTREEILTNGWSPDPDLANTLGESEHLRWNAFHNVMGYRPMSREELQERGEHYQKCVEQGIPCSNRIGKDTQARKHACLIPWEDLDDLSAREFALTGRNVDYRRIDINNVLALPDLLRAEEERPAK
ncbi:MAG: hypothetical protein IJH77_03815, partial [Mogibacterium sp.]|nr:hypothetical protein [Mogibacterium sp.]